MLEKVFCSQELSIEVYHDEKEHESSSSLKHILHTPAHYILNRSEPERDSEALRIGRAVHAAMLEPEVFAEQYVIGQKFDRRTTVGRQAHDEFVAANHGKTIVCVEDVEFIETLRAKIRRHSEAWKLLALPGEAESSIFWTDDETGIRLKCRPDRIVLLGQLPIHVSVKTTKNASKEAFRWDIENYCYDMADAMYADGIYQRYGALPKTLQLVIEKGSWEVCVYSPCRATRERGYERYRDALNLLKTCRLSGMYPGYQPGGGIEEISLPPAVLRRRSS